MATGPLVLPGIRPSPAEDHERLVRRAWRLAALGVAWHGIEAAIAIAAGVAAGSIALVGFGADSVIEGAAGFVVLWLFSNRGRGSSRAERRAQQLIAVSFYVLAAYVAVEAVRTLIDGHRPDPSWVGIGLAAVTAATMPLLAAAKARVAEQLGSSASKSESRQTLLCAYLSVGLLAGLAGNALLGWWWLDPGVALVISAVAFREGRTSWRGESCCATTPPSPSHPPPDDCCHHQPTRA